MLLNDLLLILALSFLQFSFSEFGMKFYIKVFTFFCIVGNVILCLKSLIKKHNTGKNKNQYLNRLIIQMEYAISLLFIFFLFINCTMPKEINPYPKTTIQKNIMRDVFCSELTELDIPLKFDLNKTNMGILTYVFQNCNSGLNKNEIRDKNELTQFILNSWNSCPEIFSNIIGREYVINETVSRISANINFENENLIIVSASFDGPPFNTIKCEVIKNKIFIREISKQKLNRLGGMALRPVFKFFKISKKITLET